MMWSTLARMLESGLKWREVCYRDSEIARHRANYLLSLNSNVQR